MLCHRIKKYPELASARFRIHSVCKNVHSGERIQKVADSYAGFTGYVWKETVSGKARSRLSDSGEGTKEWGRRKCEKRAKSRAGRRGKKGSSSRFFSSSPLSQFRGLDYLGAWNRLYPERKTCGFKNIRIRVTGPEEANINPKHRRCLVIRLGHRLTLSHRRLMTTPVNRHFLEKHLPR